MKNRHRRRKKKPINKVFAVQNGTSSTGEVLLYFQTDYDGDFCTSCNGQPFEPSSSYSYPTFVKGTNLGAMPDGGLELKIHGEETENFTELNETITDPASYAIGVNQSGVVKISKAEGYREITNLGRVGKV